MPDLTSFSQATPVVTCIRCGYDLRGQDEETGRCPECGLHAYWSLRAPQKLSQYPPDWVRRMSRATGLLTVVYGGMFLVLAMMSLLELFNLEEPFIIAFTIAAAFQLFGMWMLSSWSGNRIEPRALINRWALRVTPFGFLIVGVAWSGAEFFRVRMPESWVVAGFIVGALAPTAIFIRLRAVARLIGDAGLAEHSAIVGWGCLASVMLFVATSAYSEMIPLAMTTAVGLILMLLMGVTTLLCLLWGAFIFCSCTIAFSRASKVAMKAWNEGPPPL